MLSWAAYIQQVCRDGVHCKLHIVSIATAGVCCRHPTGQLHQVESHILQSTCAPYGYQIEQRAHLTVALRLTDCQETEDVFHYIKKNDLHRAMMPHELKQ